MFQVLDSPDFTNRGQSVSCQLSGTNLSASPLPIFKLDYLSISFAMELYEFSLYFGYSPLIRDMVCKCFSPFCRMSFILFFLVISSKEIEQLVVPCIVPAAGNSGAI